MYPPDAKRPAHEGPAAPALFRQEDTHSVGAPATIRPLDRPEALQRIGRWVDEGHRAERRVTPALVEHLAALTPHRVALEVARGRLDFLAVLDAVGYRPTLSTPHGTRTHLASADGTAVCNAGLRGAIAWSTSEPTCQTCRRNGTRGFQIGLRSLDRRSS